MIEVDGFLPLTSKLHFTSMVCALSACLCGLDRVNLYLFTQLRKAVRLRNYKTETRPESMRVAIVDTFFSALIALTDLLYDFSRYDQDHHHHHDCSSLSCSFRSSAWPVKAEESKALEQSLAYSVRPLTLVLSVNCP